MPPPAPPPRGDKGGEGITDDENEDEVAIIIIHQTKPNCTQLPGGERRVRACKCVQVRARPNNKKLPAAITLFTYT